MKKFKTPLRRSSPLKDITNTGKGFVPSFNGDEEEKFLREGDGDVLANRPSTAEVQVETFTIEDDDDLANNADASEQDFLRLSEIGTGWDPMRSSIEKESAEDRFLTESGGDDGLAISGEANEGDSMRMSETVNIHNLKASSNMEERLANAVRDIAADIIKNMKASKKNSVKSKDTDKEKKKTLKKLSYHEKMLRNIRLVEEHLIEETSGISTIVYSCKTCGKAFSPTVNKVHATRHAISHGVPKKRQRGQNRNYECAFCGITVKTKKEHVKHYQDIHHEETQILRCTKCSKSFETLPSLSDHIRNVHLAEEPGGKFAGQVQVCPECGRKLETKKLLNRHMKTVHRNVKTLTCNVCGKKFRDSFGLKRHLKEGHKLGADGEQLANTTANKEVPISPVVNRTQCPVSDKFVRKLNWHLRQTHGLDKHLKPTFSTFKHHCNKCGKPFRDKCNLDRHIHLCQKSKMYDQKCSICSKTFNSKRNKEIHVKEMHMTEKSCEKCGSMFKDKTDFYSHLPCHFTCKCGKKFNNHYKFDRHKKRCSSFHPEIAKTDDKSAYHNVISYQCIICQESDISAGEVSDHVANNHESLSVNTGMSCERCGSLVIDIAEHIFQKHSQVRRMKNSYVKFRLDPPLKSKPAAMKSNPVAMASKPVARKSKPATMESNPLAMESNPDAMKSKPVALKSNPVAMKSNPVAMKSNPVATKSNPNALDCKSVADAVSVCERECGRAELSTMLAPPRSESGVDSAVPGNAESLLPPPFMDPLGDPASLSETEVISLLNSISSMLQEDNSTPSLLVSGLLKLDTVSVTVPVLLTTGVGKVVRRLRDREGKVGMLAGKLISKWKRIALQYEPE